jgi:acetyl-CoA acetyltransferase
MHKEPTVILSVARTLDHPLWASGTRIIFTLLAALEESDLKKVLFLFFNGGGEATATATAIEGIT